jgi:hypothetical protein
MNFYSTVHNVEKVELHDIFCLDSGTCARHIIVTTSNGVFELTLFAHDREKLLVEQPKL